MSKVRQDAILARLAEDIQKRYDLDGGKRSIDGYDDEMGSDIEDILTSQAD